MTEAIKGLDLELELQNASAELTLRRKDLQDVIEALRNAERAEQELADRHRRHREALGAAEADSVLEGKNAIEERKTFLKSRDEADFAAARRMGLENRRKFAEKAVFEAEAKRAVAERQWARQTVADYVEDIYLPAALAFLRVVYQGQAIALTVGPEAARLFQGLAHCSIPVLGHRDLNGAVPENNKNAWKTDAAAVEIARSLQGIRAQPMVDENSADRL